MYPVLSGNLHAGEAKTTPGPISSTHGDTYGAIMVRDSFGDDLHAYFGVEPTATSNSY